MSITVVASALCFLLAACWSFVQLRNAGKTLSPEDYNKRNDICLAALLCASTLALGIWMVLFPYTGNFPCALVSSLVLAASTYLMLNRRNVFAHVTAWWDARSISARLPLAHLLIAGMSLLGTCALEIPWNTRFPLVAPQALLLEVTFAALVMELLWHATARRAAGPLLVLALMGLMGVVEAFILDFRGTPITVGDVYALGTALSVRTGYAYQLNAPMLVGIALGIAGSVLCALLNLTRTNSQPWSRKRHALGTLVLLALLVALLLPNYHDTFAIKVDYRKEWQLEDHKTYLFLPSLWTEAQELPIDRPSGYSRGATDAAEERLARLWRASSQARTYAQASTQFDELKPSVVVVMNETFSDLSSYGHLNDYTGPRFFAHDLTNTLARGSLAVSVLGGGTCNSEFELLCGQSMAFVGSNKYPYTLYDLSNVPSLARQFGELGYQTTAIHPNLASNWNRDEVYEQLGFDTFLDIESFDLEDSQLFHNTVPDAATYEAVLSQLASSSEPQFIFDVTMQNHGGYDQGGIPEYLQARYASTGRGILEEEAAAQLTEYVACIGESDRALRRFVSQLQELDRPVVLVFFGDHQPSLSANLNDVLFANESGVVHEERLYQTSYIVWANFDVEGITAQDTSRNVSASDLAATTLSLIGAPLTSAQEAQLGAQTLLSQLNLYGWRDLAGTWHDLPNRSDTSDAAMAIRDLRLISYRDFGSVV